MIPRSQTFHILRFVCRPTFSTRQSSSSSLDIEKLEKESLSADLVEDEAKRREEEIERKRNKSRLKDSDRNFLHETNPYSEPQFWYHGTLKYNRRLYGRYGQASGVNPAICWPTEQELNESLEYERVAYPYTIPQMIEEARRKRKDKDENTLRRQQEIVKKMEKLEVWKRELHEKIAKKEAEVRAAKERREKLIEDVRRHFGYTVDPRDEKFKEMLQKKEKEQKKAMKEARRKAKEEKMMAKLLAKQTDNPAEHAAEIKNEEKTNTQERNEKATKQTDDDASSKKTK